MSKSVAGTWINKNKPAAIVSIFAFAIYIIVACQIPYIFYHYFFIVVV